MSKKCFLYAKKNNTHTSTNIKKISLKNDDFKKII